MSLDMMAAAGKFLNLSKLELEIANLMNSLKEPGEGPVQRARMSNLIIFCNTPQRAENISSEIPSIVASHPARVLLLIAESSQSVGGLSASATAWCQNRGSLKATYEKITLHASGNSVDRLPYLVRGLLIGDLPTNLWWESNVPPPLAGTLLYDLAENAQQVIYDSIGWMEPAKGVVATAAWLERFERGSGQGDWRVASDLNWRRMKYWRRLMGQALDPSITPGALETITEVLVEHGPHAVIQAWELASWLAAKLGWRVQAGRFQPGVEITWQTEAKHGNLRIRIRRLAEGPSEVRRIRIACNIEGKPGALIFQGENSRRLAVIHEGCDICPRTVTLQALTLADLVGKQLSDRERDPIFRESMAVAQVMAQSVLG